MKFMQRVILVQTRGVSDPRVVPSSLPSSVTRNIEFDIIFPSCKIRTIRISLSALPTTLSFQCRRWNRRVRDYLMVL